VNAIRRKFGTPDILRRVALASLIANIGIVVTGGAVRLTGSGLGCPTWPRCDDHSYVYAPERGYHSRIEFYNRTLIGVVGTLAVLALIAVLAQASRTPRYREQRLWAILVLVGIPAQAVLGGVTTLSGLNPWVVASHFLLSTAVIAAAYQLWARCRDGATAGAGTATGLRALVWAIVGVTLAVLVAGTVTTGSGPHAGDEHAKRTGLNPEMVSQLHADLVMLLIGLSVAAWFAIRLTSGASVATRAAAVLVIVEAAQALIGFVQYFTKLPIILVGAHMLGACLVWVAALRLLTATDPAMIAAAPENVGAAVARTPERV
jgi:cytochrome c oxidase assembly protein subunit 15